MNELLEFLAEFENGASEEEICCKFRNIKKPDLVILLNGMLKANKIQVISGERSKLLYKIVENKIADYEAMIMTRLAQSGSTGMWLREIKAKTNIPHNLILKLLKNMEMDRKIRSVKSIKNNRKIYVLYGITPAEEVTGGIWFSNNDVDLAFVERLMEVIHNYCYRKEEPYMLNSISSLVSIIDLRDFINSSNIATVELSVNDVNTLVDLLISEGRMDRIQTEEGVVLRSIPKSYYCR